MNPRCADNIVQQNPKDGIETVPSRYMYFKIRLSGLQILIQCTSVQQDRSICLKQKSDFSFDRGSRKWKKHLSETDEDYSS